MDGFNGISQSPLDFNGVVCKEGHTDTVASNTFVLKTYPDSKCATPLSGREMGKTHLTNKLNPPSHFTSSLSGEVSENDCDQ